MFGDCKNAVGLIFILFSSVCCELAAPPTQPDWLIDKEKVKEPPKYEVTLKKLIETAKIRSEIEQAVFQHKYAVGHKDESKVVSEADKVLGEEFRVSQYINGLVGNPAEILNAGDEEDETPAGVEEEAMSDIIPNRVDSTAGSEDQPSETFIPEYHASKYSEISDGREVLRLDTIEEDLNFGLGVGVRMWKTLPNGALLGLSDYRIQVVGKVGGSYQMAKDFNFTSITRTMETITLWNTTRKSKSSLVLVSSEDSVHWLLADSLEKYWEWKIGTPVRHIRAFKAENLRYLAVLIDGFVLVYQYDMDKKQYWSNQVIAVDPIASEIVFLDTGYHMILAVPQNNSVLILRSDPPQDGTIHFQILRKIHAEAVASISGFQMGGYTYLATGGNEPKILRYYQGSFTPQTILEPNFGFVDMFLPIPCRTYRDDLILLVQHTITFDSHSLKVVEPLIWNGNAFEATKSVPCKIGANTLTYGVSCILDMERDEGIKGATIISSPQEDAVIVPRFEATSGFFRIATELVPPQTELQELEAILNQMIMMAAQQDVDIDEWRNQTWNIDSLDTKELIFSGQVDRLILNDEEWTDEDSAIDLNDLLEELEVLGKQMEQIDELEVQHVVVQNLFVKTLNGEPYQEIKDIIHDGTIVFEGDLTVEDFVQEPEVQGRQLDQDIELGLVKIDGNLEFDTINGVAWTDFMSQVVFKDTPIELEDLKVSGKVTLKNGIDIETLNDLKFPDDFLLSSGPAVSVITGKKTFKGMLNSNAVDCDGLINGVDPNRFISLSDDQEITGSTTFSQLEVTESFHINGTILGKNLEQFGSNPTLLDTRHIKAACNFKHLIVNGPIIIKGYFNERNFDEDLNDIVYKSDQNVTITSKKTFQEVDFEKIHLQLYAGGRLGDIDLDEFLTKSTDQVLEFGDIEGNVLIEDLKLDGLFNFINVTEMVLNSIRLDEDQVIEGDFIFKEPDLLKIDRLEVIESLNGVPVGDFISTQEPIYLKRATFTNLYIDQLNLECDIEGNALLNGKDLAKFAENRLSISRNQTITADLIVNEMEIEQNLFTETINGYPARTLIRMVEKPKNCIDLLRSNLIRIDRMEVTGNVQVKQINGKGADQIWSQVIWLDRKNVITTPISFLDPVQFDGNISVESGDLNGRNIEDFVSSLVLKGSEISLEGPVKFLKPILVLNDAEIGHFNDIAAESLAVKNKPLNFNGDVHIDGDLIVKSIELDGGKFGDFDVKELVDLYKYDPEADMHYINGEVIFKGNTYIDSLHVGGSFNGLENPDELFKSIVYKNESANLLGRITFKNFVNFGNGVAVESFNGINLPEFLENVVYVNDPRPVEISGPIIFQSPITAGRVQIRGDIKTPSIMGCNLEEWMRNTLRIDKPAIIEDTVVCLPGTLDYNNLNAVYLNGRLMSNLITLHTEQNFTGHFSFSYVELDGALISENGVNGFDLKQERNNTVMIYGDHHVTAPTTMQSFIVLQSLITGAPINGRDLRQVATLHGDLKFRSAMSFKKIHVESLYTNDIISGLNFTHWYRKSLKDIEPYEQIITGNWNISELIVQNGNVAIDFSRSDIGRSIQTLQDKYTDVCRDVQDLVRMSSKRVSFVKHFEERFEIVEKDAIDTTHAYIYSDDTILIVSKGCQSNIYRWDGINQSFERIQTVETGSIDHVEIEQNGDFVTHSEFNVHSCRLGGSNRWKFSENRMILQESGRQGDESRSGRSVRSDNSSQSQLPNFNSTINKITAKLVEELHTIRKSNSSHIVGSKFTHTLRHVASKLWNGIKQMDDVKTIMHHARIIYHTLMKPSKNHIKHEKGSDDEVGAGTPNLLTQLIDQSPLGRLNHVLDIIPLGFRNLVERTEARAGTEGHIDRIEDRLAHFIQTIMGTIPPGLLQNSSHIEHRSNVSRSMAILKDYAEHKDQTTPSPSNASDTVGAPHMTDYHANQGEAIALRVGSENIRRTLIAVISALDSSSIRLYADVVEGKIFQTIPASNPHSLVTLESQDETILAFVENRQTTRVMTYKGVQGFVEFSTFHLNQPVTQLGSISTRIMGTICRKEFLAVVVSNRIRFYEAVIGGSCPVEVSIDGNCKGWW